MVLTFSRSFTCLPLGSGTVLNSSLDDRVLQGVLQGMQGVWLGMAEYSRV